MMMIVLAALFAVSVVLALTSIADAAIRAQAVYSALVEMRACKATATCEYAPATGMRPVTRWVRQRPSAVRVAPRPRVAA